MKGVDVSTLQDVINWSKVKAAGIEFAMIKATQGRGEGATTKNLRVFTDSKFATNIKNAHNAGIPCGVYHYFTAKNDSEAVYEAKYFINTIKPYKKYIDLWCAVDVESEPHLKGVDSKTLTSATKKFMDYIKDAGYKPILYTNPNYLKYRFTPNAFNDYDIWLAHWGVSKPMSVPNTKIWQYGAGRISGINTQVDMNEGYFNVSSTNNTPTNTSTEKPKYKKNDKYIIKAGDRYTTGEVVPKDVVGWECTIIGVKSDSILLKEVYTWVYI